MVIVLKTNDLSYKDFSNINLSFKDKTYYSIIGPNNSGKSTLFKLISGIILTSNHISCNNIYLNKNNASKYIVNLGIVSRVNNNSFIFKKVIDEMMYPLTNLGYSHNKSITRIKEILELFNSHDLLNKSINELSVYDQELLLIMISLLHKPKVLLLDSVLELFKEDKRNDIIKVLNELVKEGMTIINFTNSLEVAYYSDKIILMDKYKIIGEYNPRDIFQHDQMFYEHNLEIPFLVDLAIKLKIYNLVDKEYFSMKEMVDDLWP